MNPLDVFLLLLVLAYALSGYWQGFITGAFATAGLLAGVVLGFWASSRLLDGVQPSVWVSLGGLLLVLVCASLGQTVFQLFGSRVRDRVRWQPVRAIDAVGGAALSAVAVLIVTWALGVAVSGSKLPWVSNQVRNSEVLGRVDEVMPSRAVQALNLINDFVGSSFPRYLEPFAPERIVKVGPPPPEIASDPDVRAAAASVLKIHGENSCGQGMEGTGFLYQPNRLMTNAHVVAGVETPRVLVDGGQIPAPVVYYNPDLDVAVLAVEDAGLPHLSFDRGGAARDPGAVLGYPEDGSYDVQGARIRTQQRLRSPDIYGQGSVLRDVFSVRSRIRPGNSGGPLVSPEGDVLGVVFAASVTDPSTGYVLTAGAVTDAAFEARVSTRAVSTGPCT